MHENENPNRTVRQTIETTPNGTIKTTKEYAKNGSGKMSFVAAIKHPTAHNATIILGLIAAVTLQPTLLPYADVAHGHDMAPMQAMITNTVVEATLRGDIKMEVEQIGRLDAQILAGLCMPVNQGESCQLEKIFKEQAEQRRDGYRDELDRISK